MSALIPVLPLPPMDSSDATPTDPVNKWPQPQNAYEYFQQATANWAFERDFMFSNVPVGYQVGGAWMPTSAVHVYGLPTGGPAYQHHCSGIPQIVALGHQAPEAPEGHPQNVTGHKRPRDDFVGEPSAPKPPGPQPVTPHRYHARKATAAQSCELRTWFCGYCGYKKLSASAGTDGMVRIRCPCGGVRRDNIPRMHSHWTEQPGAAPEELDANTAGLVCHAEGFKPILSCKHRPHKTYKTARRQNKNTVQADVPPSGQEKSSLSKLHGAISIWSELTEAKHL